jgi:hypothetical protein
MAPMSNQPHMNPGTVPLQQPSTGLGGILGGDPLDNHLGNLGNLGNFSQFANLGSTTNLHALSMTSHLDSIVPKVEPGITTVAGAAGVSTMAYAMAS